MRVGRLVSGAVVVVHDGRLYDAADAVAALPVRGWPAPLGDQFIAALPSVHDRLSAATHGEPIGTIADARFTSPVANPTKIVGAPVNYESHVDEARSNLAAFPHAVARIQEAGLFLKATSSLVGPGDGVALRFPDARTDHELELGVVIGTLADRVTEDDALSHVAGYAIALDMTPRGKQDRSFRKSVDTYGVLGPWLVTADEIPDPNALAIELSVNGETRQKSNTSHLIMKVQSLIAWASQYYPLYPGDVIMTGTPSGVGPVEPGDEIEATIESIGSMRVRVRALAPAGELQPANG